MDLGGVGCSTWTDPNKAKVEDGQGAQSLVPKMDSSCPLVLFNYGFTTEDLPAAATVVGVEVAVKRCTDETVKLMDSGIWLKIEETEVSPPGDNLASAIYWPTWFTWIVYGSLADLWGIPELDGDIVRSEWFGNYLQVQNLNGSMDYVAYVDVTKIRVFYTIPEVAVKKGIPLSKRISLPSQGI